MIGRQNEIMWKRLSILTIGIAALAYGQSVELGGRIGGGTFGVSSGSTAGRGLAGIEACIFCGGRLALFGEYNHWFSGISTPGPAFGFGSGVVAHADLAGAGLRIQGGGPLRLFFDVGAVVGRDEHVLGGSGAIGGALVGAGVEIPWREHWYVRPQVRAYVMSPHSIESIGIHWAIGGALGFGYRF
jgi:hypothetical protein